MWAEITHASGALLWCGKPLIKLFQDYLTPGLGAGPGNPGKTGSPGGCYLCEFSNFTGQNKAVQMQAWAWRLDLAAPAPDEEATTSTIGTHTPWLSLLLAVLLAKAPAFYSWCLAFVSSHKTVPSVTSSSFGPKNVSPSSSLLSHSALSLAILAALGLPLSLVRQWHDSDPNDKNYDTKEEPGLMGAVTLCHREIPTGITLGLQQGSMFVIAPLVTSSPFCEFLLPQCPLQRLCIPDCCPPRQPCPGINLFGDI